MRQARLKPSAVPERKRYDDANYRSAVIILAERERYGGEESLMVRWARIIMNETAAAGTERKAS